MTSSPVPLSMPSSFQTCCWDVTQLTTGPFTSLLQTADLQLQKHPQEQVDIMTV